MKKNRISQAALWTIIVLCATIAIRHHVQRGFPLITEWDVYGYYVYLPGIFTYSDITQFQFVEDHFNDYSMQSGIYQLIQTDRGRVPIYTSGLALVWSPFYLIADAIATSTNWKRDGMSGPYQWSLIFAALFYIALGLIFLRKLLLRYFDDKTVAITLGVIVFGTNLFHYWPQSPGMPHAYAFAGHALLLYCTDSWFRKPSFKYAIGSASIMAILCLIRPTEIITILIPIGYAVANRRAFSWKPDYLYQLFAAALIAIVLILPQLFLWMQNTGQLIYNAYVEAGHKFYFDGRFLLDGLISYRKGWLVYTPIAIFGLAGFVIWRNVAKKWLLVAGLIVLCHTYITFSWHWWWYANSFGARPMVHIYAELSIGLAALFQYVSKKKIWRIALMLLVALLVCLNLLQIWQYNNKILPGDGVNKYFYWRSFGKTDISRHELKYLFIPHLKNIESYNRVSLIEKEMRDSSDLRWPAHFFIKNGKGSQRIAPDVRYSDGVSVVLDKETADMINGRWLLMNADLFIENNNFNSSKNAQFVLEAKRNGTRVFWQNLNFQIYSDTGGWVSESWEYKPPGKLQEGDRVSAYIWNKQSPDTIYLHKLGISLLAEQ